MKKLIAYLILAAMLVGLVACGDTPEETTTKSETVQTTESVSDTDENPTESFVSDNTETFDDSSVAESDSDESDSDVTQEGAESSTSSDTESGEDDDTASATEDSDKTEDTDVSEGGEDSEKPKESVEIEETEETETEDPRLSAEYAPITYFDAKAIYELTRDGVYEDMAQLFYGYDEVTFHKEKGQRAYTKIKTWNDLQTASEAYISLCTAPMEVAPIFAVKYRTTTPGLTMEVYTDSVNNGVTGSNVVRIPVDSNGEWHVEYVSLVAIRQFNGATANYFRFDIMNSAKLPVDAYMEFEYFGFFNSEDEVEMFETGKYVPVIYVDQNSGYTDATNTIVHASSIDMINGAGGIGATKFDYRGGNTIKGVDKFNHNGTTLSDGKLVFSGWTVVEGGVEKFVWSIDGLNWYDATLHQMGGMGDLGNPHISATESYTGATVKDVANSIKGGGYQGNINVTNPEDRAKGIACNLLEAASVGDKVNVRFAAVPKNAPNQLCLIAYVKNVEVVAEFEYEEETEYEETFATETVEPEKCERHETSYYWYPAVGEAVENKLCLHCLTVIESRSVAFYNSFDIIEDANGQKLTGLYGANKAFDKDGAYIVLRETYDFVLHGWFAANGGVKDYMYSVDGGETWLVAGNSDNLTTKFGPEHIGAINAANLGIAKYDVKGRYSVSIPLKQFALENEETTVNVLFGAKLANNETVVITIANIKNVKIPAAPAGEDPQVCTHDGVKWKPVIGELKEIFSCDACGESITRDVAFYNSFDVIEHGGANISGGYGANKVIEKDGSAIVLRGGNDFVVQGWFACNGGVKDYVYSVDGGETWLEAGNNDNLSDKFTDAHISAIEKANLGIADYDVKGMYRLNFPLGQFMKNTETTVDVLFGAVPVNNDGVVITIANIKGVNLPADPNGGDPEPEETTTTAPEPEETTTVAPEPEPEEEIKFIKAINDLTIGGVNVHNPYGGYGGELFTYDASEIVTTTFTVKWAGWAGINDGINKWVYSTDGGATWENVSGTASTTTDGAIINALTAGGLTNAIAKGTIGIIADLSTVTTATAEVIFAAVPNSDTSRVVPMVKIINIKLPNDCTHPSVASWTPVVGETKESGSCTRCGETVTRDITFVICSDKVIYNGGEKGWAGTKATSTPLTISDVASVPVSAGTGITVQGWVCMNGGISAYKWSVDGVTWHDAGTGYYTNSGIPGAVNGYNTGIANFTSNCQYDINLSGLCGLSAGTYTVYLGAVPANNTGVVVPVLQIDNVVVQ